MIDYLSDLSGYSPDSIEAACVSWRRKPEAKFFPRSGELLGILQANKFSFKLDEETQRQENENIKRFKAQGLIP